jgi:hypothetical protein
MKVTLYHMSIQCGIEFSHLIIVCFDFLLIRPVGFVTLCLLRCITFSLNYANCKNKF